MHYPKVKAALDRLLAVEAIPGPNRDRLTLDQEAARP